MDLFNGQIELRRVYQQGLRHELKRKLEFGAHSGGRGGLRTEYAIRLYAEAKELRPSMSSSEIIQKLARHYNEEFKYAIVGRGITRIDDLVELLENFDRIGPVNISGEAEKERKIQNEIKYNHQGKEPQVQPSWRAQPEGSSQDRMRRPRPLNRSSFMGVMVIVIVILGSYGSRAERNTEQNTSGNIDRNNRPMENRSWRNNPQSTINVSNS